MLSKPDLLCRTTRSCPQVFCKKVVLKNFAKFTGRDPCWNFSRGCFYGTKISIALSHQLHWKNSAFLGEIILEEPQFIIISVLPIVRWSSPSASWVVLFFDISICRGHYSLQCHVLKQTYKKKISNFQNQISFYFDVTTRYCFIKVISATNFNFIPSLKLKIRKGNLNTCIHVCILYKLEKRCTIEGLIK